jgi:integrase
MPLTDTAVKNAKPADKPFKLTDEKSLYLYVMPAGGKLWRMQYRFGGKQKVLAFGTYPAVSLREARERRDEARKLLSNGVDPGEVKKAQKATVDAQDEETFEKAARSWFDTWKVGKALSNSKRVGERLENDVLPWLGKKPISEVREYDVFATCDRIQKRGAIDTAHRVLGYLDAIFAHVIAEDAKDEAIYDGTKQKRIKSNPCKDLRERNVPLLQPAPPKKHYAHFKDTRTGAVSTAKLGEYLRAVDAFSGTMQVWAALKLAPLLFVRPGELRKARWSEIDLGRAEWSFTVSKAKAGEAAQKLVIPLPRQAVTILEELRPLTGAGEYVFRGHWNKDRPMSDAAVNAAIRRLGFDTRKEISGHGFRHVASTLLYEQGYPSDAIEKSLGHRIGGVKGEYDHAQYFRDRVPMMQAWADFLDKLKAGADVIPIRA